jgi:hypothetical protein
MIVVCVLRVWVGSVRGRHLSYPIARHVVGCHLSATRSVLDFKSLNAERVKYVTLAIKQIGFGSFVSSRVSSRFKSCLFALKKTLKKSTNGPSFLTRYQRHQEEVRRDRGGYQDPYYRAPKVRPTTWSVNYPQAPLVPHTHASYYPHAAGPSNFRSFSRDRRDPRAWDREKKLGPL